MTTLDNTGLSSFAVFNQSNSAHTMTITNSNGAVTAFASGSTAGAATIINNAGSTIFGNGSTAADATVIANGGGRITIAGNASGGQARFITNAGGDFDISDLASSGTTAGSIEGAGSYLLGSKQLTVGGNNLSTTVSGIIADGGFAHGTGASLVKTGSGTLTLSGANTYTGATTVSGGILLVNGSIASSSLTTVAAGAVLGGGGTVGNTLIDGGTLSPGNSIGALRVDGNLELTAASTYRVEVSPATSDFTRVTGTATLGGATVAAEFVSGSYVEKRYTILTADGGVSGTFAGPVNTNLPQNFSAALAHDGNNAYLDLTLLYRLAPGPLNGNQQAVANTLEGFFNTAGGIPLAFGWLDAGGLSRASGEVATGAPLAAFQAQGQFLNAMTDPFAAGPGGASSASPAMSYAPEDPRGGDGRDAYAALVTKAPPAMPFEPRWQVFGAAYGGTATIGGNAATGSHDVTARAYGGMGGAVYAAAPDTRVGFALGGGGTTFGLSEGLGSGRSDLFQAGLFARQGIGHAGYLTGAFAYGWHDVSTERVAPTGERLRGAYKANVLSGRIEAGWRMATALAGVTPYAAAQAIGYRMPSYLEQGNGAANSFALGYARRTVTATRSELGLRLDRSLMLGDALVTLRGRAAWAHNFDTERSVAATFQALPGTGFLVNGAQQARDAALVSAGAEIGWRNGLALVATFEGEFSSTTKGYAGKGAIRYVW